VPILYRVVESDPPTDRDFVADRLRGHRHRLADETDEEWDSFSAFTDLTKVRQTAAFLKQRRRLPALYVVRLDIPEDAPIEVFPYRGSRTHFGVRGDPALLHSLATVVAQV
jgi:hypothetical protein